MVHLSSAPCLGSGQSQHDAVTDHPPSGPPQGNPILHPPLPHQHWISIKHWQQVLGELQSMALAVPGARGLLSHMQEALRHVNVKRVTLTRGMNASLSDFRWLVEDLETIQPVTTS